MTMNEAATNEELDREIKELIIEALMLEDVTREDIVSSEPLFVEGLGLDSIDALELAIALEGRYGVKAEEDPDRNREYFRCVDSLVRYVAASRTK